MEKDLSKPCACKGIRSCLACEKVKETQNSGSSSDEEDMIEYTFCQSCGVCWPSVKPMNDHNEFRNSGFYLPGIVLIRDFINKDEEREVVSNIDLITWLPSQSGRRKQDFGPKVNFKKHKVKRGEFSGFPEFTGFIIDRLGSVPSVSSFLPVELCNLEYCPERGSAIEPHLDDSWLWGERLITLNLLSNTILTLTPTDTCEFNAQCKYKNVIPEDLSFSTNAMSCEHTSKGFLMENSCECGHILTLEQKHDENHSGFSPIVSSCNPIKADVENEAYVSVTDDHVIPVKGYPKIPKSEPLRIVPCTESECLQWNSKHKLKKIVKIPLPPRSLLVLYGCARYHWLHAIKRNDIKNRRLAMTFRELSSEFLPGGPQFELGKELLDVAKVQCKS